MARLFGTDGVRGKAGEDLTAAVSGLTFVVDGLKKTSNGRKFRPVRILADN